MSTALSGRTDALAHLGDPDELTHAIDAGTPLWSENYLSQAWSPESAVGMYVHFNRPPYNPALWHELFVVYLPGDEFLVAKGFLREERPGVAGPRGPGLTYTCDEPWVQWTKRFDGAVQKVSGQEMRENALRDGPHTAARAEFVFRAMTPAFGVGDLGAQHWAVDHYEQHCTVAGWVECGTDRYEFDGTGLRDHSIGPRDLSLLSNHVWLHGQFPSGRTFMAMHVRNRSGKGHLDYHVLGEPDGTFRAASLRKSPLIEHNAEFDEGYVLEFDTEDGPETIRADILTGHPLGLVERGEFAHGIDPRPGASHTDWECQSRFEWDGEVGYGLTERTVAYPLQ